MPRWLIATALLLVACRDPDPRPSPPAISENPPAVAAVESAAPIAVVESRALTIDEARQALIERLGLETARRYPGMLEFLERADFEEGVLVLGDLWRCSIATKRWSHSTHDPQAPVMDDVRGVIAWDSTRRRWIARVTGTTFLCKRPPR